ncbi:hypothetical protein LCGC14_3064570 [marine sediment metagenome]|uniref:Uncharacterized protein n=1 Tax=marine sediment metagenome TaxID=412755 RepID=A0A0F8YQP3_9ZZZZ
MDVYRTNDRIIPVVCYIGGKLELMIEKVLSASMYYDSLAISYGIEIFEGLVTSEYKRGKHRGLHISAVNDKFTTPVFFNGCGWVDIGFEFALSIIEKFKLDSERNIELKKEPNTWVRKENSDEM